jgi:hypothetical protein
LYTQKKRLEASNRFFVIPKRFERLTHALEGTKLNHSLHIASQFISFELFFTFDKPFDN